MTIEVTGDINDSFISLSIDSIEYVYSTLSIDDKAKVDNFKNFILNTIGEYSFLAINFPSRVEDGALIELLFDGVDGPSVHWSLCDYNKLSDGDKLIINNLINI